MLTNLHRRPLCSDAHLPTELHPILRRILASRHVQSATELDLVLRHLLPFQQLHDIETAVQLLADSLRQQARIMIVADYDADGATSCALACRALQMLGAQHVGYIVPNREKHGYGLTSAIVEQVRDWQPDLLLTVDNGIASASGVTAAQAAGIKVLVTDHHLPPNELPSAEAIVNPNLTTDQFPSKHLAGVGVIFYVMLALRSHLREQGWFAAQNIAEPNLATLLDLVALGTVADVVVLDYNNRILVEQGLRRIRANQCSAGIRALVQVTGRSQADLTTRDLGFSLGPRLNAAGRMDDMSHGIQCLLADTDSEALSYAGRLDLFNQERQYVEGEMLQDALSQLEQLTLEEGEQAALGVCLLDPNWHVGVIGLLASRIKDRLHRPVIVFTTSEENELLKGSARSVQGVHIRDVLATIKAQHPALIDRFGGHAMAAGLSIPADQFATFQQIFDDTIRQQVSAEDLTGVIYSDGELSSDDFNLPLAEALRQIPWGQGFVEPVFDGEFELISWRVLKDKHLKMVVRPVGSEVELDAIAFNNRDDLTWSQPVQRVQLAYRLEVNNFRNLKSVQLLVDAMAVVE